MLCLEVPRAFTACDKQLQQNLSQPVQGGPVCVSPSSGYVLLAGQSQLQKVGYQGLSKDVYFPSL